MHRIPHSAPTQDIEHASSLRSVVEFVSRRAEQLLLLADKLLFAQATCLDLRLLLLSVLRCISDAAFALHIEGVLLAASYSLRPPLE
jgi:hypothetical protein